METLLTLGALGLVEHCLDSVTNGYITDSETLPITLRYFEHEYVFDESVEKLHIGHVLYTKMGEALFKAVKVDEVIGFWENFCLPVCEANMQRAGKN